MSPAPPVFFSPLAGLMALLLAFLPAMGASAAEAAAVSNDATLFQFRLAFSARTLEGFKRSDALASVTAWGRQILNWSGTPIDPDPDIIDDPAVLFSRMHAGKVEGAVVLTEELLAQPQRRWPKEVFITTIQGRATERYLLLANTASGITNVAGLRGCSLDLQQGSRAALIPHWLDLLFLREGLGAAADFLGPMTRQEKPSRPVLRVFFRQADACVVSEATFQTMGELNPQVARQVTTLAISPEVMPSVFFFRPSFVGPIREQAEAAVRTVHESVAGQQVMTVFQADSLRPFPFSCLDPTRAVLEEWARAIKKAGPAMTGPPARTEAGR